MLFHTVGIQKLSILASPIFENIGHVLNEQGTGYEHIFFLVRMFNID